MEFERLEDKDPDATGKDYVIDLAPLRNSRDGAASNYLQTGETIQTLTSVTTSDPLLTVDSSVLTDSASSITVKLSGGTVNSFATVTARFMTSQNRGDDRTFRIFITPR